MHGLDLALFIWGLQVSCLGEGKEEMKGESKKVGEGKEERERRRGEEVEKGGREKEGWGGGGHGKRRKERGKASEFVSFEKKG